MHAAVDLFWLPLGAGGHFVRYNGRVYEALVALRDHRPRRDLYHSALEVRLGDERFVIEVTPVRRRDDETQAVAHGAVGASWAGRWRIFRYEVVSWLDGDIPDVAEAVESPRRISDDEAVARRVLGLVPHVPPLVWGRDELRTGDMWNSNSVVSWLLARSGADVGSIELPAGGRAPGWNAGLSLAESRDKGFACHPVASSRIRRRHV